MTDTPSTPDAYLCGLDLGQVSDRTALAALGVIRGTSPGTNTYQLLFLQRFPRGTPYPTIGDRVAEVFSKPPLAGQTLAIDGSGVGRAVVDHFRRLRLSANFRPVSITGGSAATRAPDGYWHIAKQNLVSATQLVMQTRRIAFAPNLQDLDILVQELQAFRVKITRGANELYEVREGEHDDMVLAVAMALWFGENTFTGEWTYRHREEARTEFAKAPKGVFQTDDLPPPWEY